MLIQGKLDHSFSCGDGHKAIRPAIMQATPPTAPRRLAVFWMEASVRCCRGPAEFGSLVDVDVNMEMMLLGNQISFTLWPDTVPKPAIPQLQVTDDTISQPGAVGLIMNVSDQWQTSGEHVVVDFFSMQPVPEPTSALLVVAGCVPLLVRRRRFAITSGTR